MQHFRCWSLWTLTQWSKNPDASSLFWKYPQKQHGMPVKYPSGFFRITLSLFLFLEKLVRGAITCGSDT